MKKIVFTLLFFSSFLIGSAREVKAGYCWHETAYYEKYGCQIIGRTPAGKYILLCCN
jgi:thiosulfate reductase cytochrome b subunit